MPSRVIRDPEIVVAGDHVSPATSVSTGSETPAQFVDISDIAPITAAQGALIGVGAKAAGSCTLNAYASMADGQTLVFTLTGWTATFSIKKTSAGGSGTVIDITGASTLAAAAAIIGPAIAAAGGSFVDYAGTVGAAMSFTAKSYGQASNGTITGSLLASASAGMTLGLDPYSNPPRKADANTDGGLASANYVKLTALPDNATLTASLAGKASTANAGVLAEGSLLGDASVTIQPFTDQVSKYSMPAATRSTNRTVTLGITSPFTGLSVLIEDRDLSANTLTITNGGTNGGSVVFPTSHTKPMGMWWYWNSADWVFNGFVELAA